MRGLDEILIACAAKGIALAYSGGVDSSFLRWRLETLPETAGRFRAVELETPRLDVPEVAANAPDRCYHCKRRMFALVAEFAAREGLGVMMDGTNADDLKAYRPGLRALREAGVVSPLAEAGLGKAEIRRLARAAHLACADEASSPCFATRFPYGTRLEPAALARVEAAEEFLRARLPRGTDVRVRCEADGARVEVSSAEVPRLASAWPEIASRLAALGFPSARLDPAGYRRGRYDGVAEIAPCLSPGEVVE